jgi:tripartite-type tricarboxylate transporter receptor subunit TctC
MFSASALAQSFPSKPITVIVGVAPGGTLDTLSRLLSKIMTADLKQTVIVENVTGAGGLVALKRLIQAPADGHTLYISSTSFTTGAALQPKLPFDPINDVTGVTLLGQGPLVFVCHPSLPVKSMRDLVRLTRAKPGQLNYTSSGVGGINHLGTEVLLTTAKINMVHVPQKGMSPAITDLISGQVQVLLVSLPAVTVQMKAGRLRVLAVSTAKRSGFMPDLPTVAEAGVAGYDVSLWWGLFAPARTPKAVIDRLNNEVHKTLSSEQLKKQFSEFGAEASPTTSEAFNQKIKSEITNWRRIIVAGNIKGD